MKSIITVFLIVFLIAFLYSCEKEKATDPSGSERHQTGTWKVYPVGDDTDFFSIRIWSDIDSLYNVEKSGQVSDGPVIIPMYSGIFYTVGYRNTTCDSVMFISEQQDTAYHYYCHKFIDHQGSNSQMDFIDSIPATIY